ncbi:transcriptional regulator, MerR family protein [Actinoplanes italicus]|uniref:DNA-binding transcriptional MerR regulator n=1 Tax=Actinoplanes italicus TaxID=113567 RepID=A0A2T0K4E9_9ACTN|nr:MerR family transcriptional regulator [Actinoplanes italicus]PRX17744.1 DNA-binding transcriptional MerR regulator [Actinoplanes italicus]GIE35751.1 transcriptional regulator, MerR family protein [Actinoplanes italicus]
MAWSTRELAELSGTTVNTIRHYHRLSLLEEPERRNNGYKQYQVRHLVSLLRIRRLTELGVPLARIRAEGDYGPELLRQIDADLAAEIKRLGRARSDIAVILRDGGPADAPAGFESVAPRLSAADHSLLHVFAQLYDEDTMRDLRRMVEADTDPLTAEIDALPPDADERTRQSLAEKLAPTLARHLIDYPWLNDPAQHLSKGRHVTRQTFVDAVVASYNPAQLDVLSRAGALAQQRLSRSRAADIGDERARSAEVPAKGV